MENGEKKKQKLSNDTKANERMNGMREQNCVVPLMSIEYKMNSVRIIKKIEFEKKN